MAYLDLLRLYRTLSRAADFNALRQQFAPFQCACAGSSRRLTAWATRWTKYLDALAEIEAEWSSPNVLHVLEKHMFYRPGDAQGAL